MLADGTRQGCLDYGVGLQCFELFQAAMKSALDAGLVAGQAIQFILDFFVIQLCVG